VDDADVTLNVCLGKVFEGGHLFFKGLKDSTIQKIPRSMHSYQRDEQLYDLSHEVGVGVIHLGNHIHGAKPIEKGERINLIMWCKVEPYSN